VLSYIFDLPSGATIIILCALGYMVGSLLAGRKTPKAVSHSSQQPTEWL